MQLIEGLQREIEQLREINKNFLGIMKKNEIKFEAVEKVTPTPLVYCVRHGYYTPHKSIS